MQPKEKPKRVLRNPELAPRREAIAQYIGGRIRAIRDSLGMSQKGLAEATGLSQAVIDVIERADSCPNVAYVLMIADGLDVKVTDILPPSGRHKNADKIIVGAAESKMLEAAKELVQANGLTVVEPRPTRRSRKTESKP